MNKQAQGKATDIWRKNIEKGREGWDGGVMRDRKYLHNQAIERERGSEGGDERALNESIMINQEAFPSLRLIIISSELSSRSV